MARVLSLRASLLDVPTLRALLGRALATGENHVASEIADEILDRWARAPWKKL